MIIALALAAAAVITAPLLIVLGFRGKRLDTHPVCRRCRFDLYQTDITAPNARCPECGSDLTRPRAVATGNRKRQNAPIAAGSFIIAAMVLLGVVLIIANNSALNPSKPVWLLEAELRFAPRKAADAALDELISRLVAGTIEDDVIKRLIPTALREREAAALAELPAPASAEVLVAAAVNRWLTKEQAERYARSMISVAGPEMRDRYLAGAPFWLPQPTTDAQPGQSESIGYSRRLIALRVNGEPVELVENARTSEDDPAWFGDFGSRSGGGTSSSSSAFAVPYYRSPEIDLPVGEHTIEADWELRLYLTPNAVQQSQDVIEVEPNAIETFTYTATFTVHDNVEDVLQFATESTPGVTSPDAYAAGEKNGNVIAGPNSGRFMRVDPVLDTTNLGIARVGRDSADDRAWIAGYIEIVVDGEPTVLFSRYGRPPAPVRVAIRPLPAGHTHIHSMNAEAIGLPLEGTHTLRIVPDPEWATTRHEVDLLWNEPIESTVTIFNPNSPAESADPGAAGPDESE